MVNINVEVSNGFIENLKKLGYEIVKIDNPKSGELYICSNLNDVRDLSETDILVAKGNLNYGFHVIVRKILKWPSFLGDDCESFQLSTTVIFLLDKRGNYSTVKLTMLTYDFREYPRDVKIMRKDCAT